MDQTPDLWPKLLLRLQSHAWKRLRGRGVAILRATLVLQDGILVAWSSPRSETFEPCGNTSENRLLAALAGEVGTGDTEPD